VHGWFGSLLAGERSAFAADGGDGGDGGDGFDGGFDRADERGIDLLELAPEDRAGLLALVVPLLRRCNDLSVRAFTRDAAGGGAEMAESESEGAGGVGAGGRVDIRLRLRWDRGRWEQARADQVYSAQQQAQRGAGGGGGAAAAAAGGGGGGAGLSPFLSPSNPFGGTAAPQPETETGDRMPDLGLSSSASGGLTGGLSLSRLNPFGAGMGAAAAGALSSLSSAAEFLSSSSSSPAKPTPSPDDDFYASDEPSPRPTGNTQKPF
jgi:hypothetical protein